MNRKRFGKWLPPSLQNRINHTFKWIDKLCSFIPESILHIEVGKFDIAKMINPEVHSVIIRKVKLMDIKENDILFLQEITIHVRYVEKGISHYKHIILFMYQMVVRIVLIIKSRFVKSVIPVRIIRMEESFINGRRNTKKLSSIKHHHL